jgi:uncharacterized protein (TIGR02284 family)
MNDKQANEILNRLIRVSKDGEAGFRVASESVRNRGLKALFKSYAQQRAQFVRELQTEVERRGYSPRQKGSFLASIHRGWINIKAAMTIGPQKTEEVVIAEVHRGEKTAIRNYLSALSQTLPSESAQIIQDQYAAIGQVSARIDRLKGNSGKRMVIRLFDQEVAVRLAIEELQKRGFPKESISRIDMEKEVTIYQGEEANSTVGESASAGALGGTIIGASIGLIAGFGSTIVPNMDLGMGASVPGALIIGLLIGAGVGAVMGTLLGALIGQGVSEEDEYLYADTIAHGSILLCVETGTQQADEAAGVMRQVEGARIR